MRNLRGLCLLSFLVFFSCYVAVPAKTFSHTIKLNPSALADIKTDFEQARELINNNQFQDAVTILLKLLKNDPQNANLNFLVGYCYYNVEPERNKALSYLEKAIVSTIGDYDDNSYKERSAPVYAFFYLGKCYHWAGRLSEALDNFEKFRGFLVNKSDKLINQKNFEIFNEVNAAIAQVKNARNIIASPLKIDFLKIPLVNTLNYSCYGAQLTSDGNMMYYSRERISERIRGKSDLFVLKRQGQNWMKNEQAGQNLNGPYNDVFNSIAPDGKFLLYSSDRKGVYNVFYCSLENNKWSEPFDNLSINSNFNETYAALSADGNKMYFVSDRPGGFGGKDIYKIEKKNDGSWTQPENLGFTVNTSKDEDTPWLSEDGTRLYFSSEGHATIGGYDIFYSDFKNNMWAEPMNMGYPVNSVANDLYFKYYHDFNLILFSSDRKSGGATYEIMAARYNDSTTMVELFKQGKETLAADTLKEGPAVEAEKPLLVQLKKETEQKNLPPQTKTDQQLAEPRTAVEKKPDNLLQEKEKKARQDSAVKVRQKQLSDSLALVRKEAIKKESRTVQDQNVSVKARLRQDSIAKAQENDRKKALAKATQEKLQKLREKARNDSIVNAKRVEDSLKIAAASIAAKEKFRKSQQLAEASKNDTATTVTLVTPDSAATISETIARQQDITDSITRVKKIQDSLNRAVALENARLEKEKEKVIAEQVVTEVKPEVKTEVKAEVTTEVKTQVREETHKETPVIALMDTLKPEPAQLISPDTRSEQTVTPPKQIITPPKQTVTQPKVLKPASSVTAYQTKKSSASLPPCGTAGSDTVKRFTVQVGAGWMKIKYFKNIDQKKICYGPDGLARIIVGVFNSRKEAENEAAQLRMLGFTDAWVPPVDEKRCLCPDNDVVNIAGDHRENGQEAVNDADTRYTVQVGAGNMKIKYFKALQQVNACNGTDGLVRFTFGIFNTLEDAVKAKDKIVKLGFSDAWTPVIDENRCGSK